MLFWLAMAGQAFASEISAEQAGDTSQQNELLQEALPDAPKMKEAKASHKKTIKVSWKKVKDADGYVLFRQVNDGDFKKIADLSGEKSTSFINKKVALNKTYTYKAVSYTEEDGEIVYSEMSDESVSASPEIYMGKNGMMWPCPASHQISSYFGRRSAPTRGASSYHKGLDIRAPKGSAILSVGSGKVVEAAYSRAMGNYVKISHGNGLYTVYEHASKLLVKKGDIVEVGQKIAKVGSTGIATGNHLHFGVIYNGTYKNPLKYLKK